MSFAHLFPLKPYKSTIPFTVIHGDIWGPCRIWTSSSKKWFVTFIDDHTRLSWLYLIREKYDVETILKIFYTMVQIQLQKNIKILRNDNSREYFKNVFDHFFFLKNELFIKVLTAKYLINRMPNKVLNFETPFDVFHKFFPMNM